MINSRMSQRSTRFVRRIRPQPSAEPVVAYVPAGVPITASVASGTTTQLPRWPTRINTTAFNHPDRNIPKNGIAEIEDAAPPVTNGAAFAASATYLYSPESIGEYRTDRAAARYAPIDAHFHLEQRSFPILTVSMSGISLRWSSNSLPCAGTILQGSIASGTSAGPFEGSVQIVRVDTVNHLVAARFVKMSGQAIDRLLVWLVQLDRIDNSTTSES